MWRDSMNASDEEKAKRDRIIDDYKQVRHFYCVVTGLTFRLTMTVSNSTVRDFESHLPREYGVREIRSGIYIYYTPQNVSTDIILEKNKIVMTIFRLSYQNTY